MLTREQLIAEITEQLPELSDELLAVVASKCWKSVDVQNGRFYVKKSPRLVVDGGRYQYLRDSCRLSPVPVGTEALWTSQVRVDTPEGNTGRIVVELIPPKTSKENKCKLRFTLLECDGTVLTTMEADWQEKELYQILVGDYLYELDILYPE